MRSLPADPNGATLSDLTPFALDVWVVEYPVRYFALDISARMTVIRLSDASVMLHSPGPVSMQLKSEIEAIGPVTWIIAPGTFHHLHVGAAQATFPNASTWICPGLETKRPDIGFDGILSDDAPPEWGDQFDLVVVAGNRLMSEVAFYHRASRTLLLVDLIEWIGDNTPRVGWALRIWWAIFRMWNKPRPAPEYAMGWRNKKTAAGCLQRILRWDFQRIVISHGDLVTETAQAVAREAWASVLRHG